MEITYLGGTAFRLKGKEVTVVTDPPAGSAPVTDVVTLSKDTDAHQVGPRTLSGPGEYEIAETLVSGVATGLIPGQGPANTAYILHIDDITVCHLGLLADRLSDQQVEEMGNIDVLMIPVGGGGSLGPEDAAELVTQLEPSVVVPMHYANGTSGDLAPVENFCREMGLKETIVEPKLIATRGSLATQSKVAVLEVKKA